MDATSNAADGPVDQRRQYPLTVDGRPLMSTVAQPTGAQIKALAGVDPSFALYLEGRAQEPDSLIADGQAVDLREPGREKFYTAPPAVFGGTHV